MALWLERKFNENVLKKLALVILILSALIYFWPDSSSGILHTRRFCAYGKLYVEFEHDNTVWGTTVLDSNGRPIPCDEIDGIQENVRQSI